MPVLVFEADEAVDTADVLVQLKQYNVLGVRVVLGKVTVWPDTFVAVPIPGQAVPPEGQPILVVLTVQLPVVVLTVYPVGKVTCTLASVPPEVWLAQTVPVVGVLVCSLSNLIRVWLSVAALA